MHIRFYRTQDYPQLIRLLAEAGLYDESLHTRAAFTAKIAFDPESITVAETDGRIVGTALFTYDPLITCGWNLVVAPKYRRQGIGSKLADRIEEILRARGVREFHIFILQDNAASIALNEKCGYKTYTENGKPCKILWMEKSLEQKNESKG